MPRPLTLAFPASAAASAIVREKTTGVDRPPLNQDECFVANAVAQSGGVS
jgi:hypothetical protein